MNKNAEKWVEALRSGRFEQTQGQLGVELTDGRSAYCCLGVACIVAHEAGVIESFDISKPDLRSYPDVAAWLGLAQESGRWDAFIEIEGHEGRACSLSELNDGGKQTFEQIAAVIESEPEGLFDATGNAEHRYRPF